MGTTDKIIQYFIKNRVEYFTINDIVKNTDLRTQQVTAVIQFWRRYGKVERLMIRYSGNKRKYALYRLKTAGKKYINVKANKLIYVI